MLKKGKKITLVAGITLFFTINCFALQIKTAVDNETIVAHVSATELTRIFVDQDRIKHVHGLEGSYVYQNDNEQGAIFIKPTPLYQTRPFNIFITTEQGRNYPLLLMPVRSPAETIMLEPKGVGRPQAARWEELSPYEQTLVALISNMVNDKMPDGYAVQQVANSKRLYLGNIAYLYLKTVYQGDRLRGEIYQLKNRLKKPITVTEKEFYRPGTRAVAIDNQTIAPKKSTYIYVVMSNG